MLLPSGTNLSLSHALKDTVDMVICRTDQFSAIRFFSLPTLSTDIRTSQAVLSFCAVQGPHLGILDWPMVQSAAVLGIPSQKAGKDPILQPDATSVATTPSRIPGLMIGYRARRFLGVFRMSNKLRAIADFPRAIGIAVFAQGSRSPRNLNAGVDLFLTRGTKKGDDGTIYAAFNDARTGETVYRSPQDLAELAVAFPGQMQTPGKRAWAVQGGKLRSVPKSAVDLVVPHMEDAFSPLGNMIPFKSAMKGQRMAMGGRFLTQALPLAGAEAPLVQAGVPGQPDRSFEQEYGEKLGAIRAKQPAQVTHVTPDEIKLRYADGTTESLETANQFPFNRKSYFHQTALVKPGDVVQPGQLLAHSNYTDKEGQAALGMNARVAYSSWDGFNHEDAIVISEGFAKRMTSDHLYPHRFEPSADQHKVGRGSFLALFPSKYERKQLETIGDDGMVKPGTVLNYGDPMVLAARVMDKGVNRVHKPGARSFADASMTWEHHSPGVVTDAVNSKNGMTILVRSLVPQFPERKQKPVPCRLSVAARNLDATTPANAGTQ